MSSWPAPARAAALHGPAGEFVERTAPHTESDPMALLAQFLVAFGAAAGRNVRYTVEATDHHLNEFLILVGPSGKGRKGSSWDHVAAILAEVDPDFARGSVSSGLASGEGLIWEVRDDPDNQIDKRRLVLESEFAQVLKVLAREGNTLSPVVRNAWDGKTLQTISKNSPVRAQDAHVSIVGHITKDELLRFVSGTELANGFFNRFLVIAVQRSQELPFGGRLSGDALTDVREATRTALRFASLPRTFSFNSQARERWIEVTARSPAAKKAYSAPPRGAPRPTSSASLQSMQRSTARRRSSSPISRRALPSGATASNPPAGSLATASATLQPTRSGRSQKIGPQA